MIINEKKGDILDTFSKRHVAFAVNSEGINNSGFAGNISRMYWPGLLNIQEAELGTVYTKEYNNFVFHALVCHSLMNGWTDTEKVITNCFNAIPTNDTICSIAIGTGLVGLLSGANWQKIKEGMEKSKKEIIIYTK